MRRLIAPLQRFYSARAFAGLQSNDVGNILSTSKIQQQCDDAVKKMTLSKVPSFTQCRQLHVANALKCDSKPSDKNSHDKENVGNLQNMPDYVRNHVFLTDLPFYFIPNFWKSMRNKLFEFLIRGYFDHDFSMKGFVTGATQAVLKISNALADGNVQQVEEMGVLSPDLIAEIKENLGKMTAEQREFLRVHEGDILRNFVYEIGIIMDDESDEKFVEILFILHGQHGLTAFRQEIQDSGAEGLDKLMKVNSIVNNALQPFGPHEFVCNYRFIKQFRSIRVDSTHATHWVINKLNHFRPLHYVLRQHFERPQQ